MLIITGSFGADRRGGRSIRGAPRGGDARNQGRKPGQRDRPTEGRV
jgi:hypothetical protein